MKFLLVFSFLCFLLLDVEAQWKPFHQPKGTVINAIEPNDEDVYLVADSGVFIYNPQMNTMSKFLDMELNNNPAKVLLKQSEDNMFVGTWGGGVLRTIDGGSTWHFINNNLTSKLVRSITEIDNELFVCAGNKIFRSDNNGTNWNILGLSSLYYNGIVKVVDSIYLFPSANGMYISKDTLKSLSHISATGNQNILALESDEVSGNLAYVNPSEVYVSLDSANTWNNKSGNLPTGLKSLVMKQDTLITYTYDSLFISYDLGDTWSNIPFMINQKISSLHFLNGRLFVGGQDHVFYSTDFGANWVSNNDSFPEKTISLDLPYGESHFIRTHDDNIYELTQDSTWEIQTTNTNNDFTVTTLQSIDTVVFASGSRTYISSDTLKSWQEVYGGVIRSIVHMGDTLFGINSGIIRSVDGGLTWQDANIGLPGGTRKNIYMYQNILYTILSSGSGQNEQTTVYQSTNGGDVWEIAEGSFFHENQITTLKSNGSMWVATNRDCEIFYKQSSENWSKLATSSCFSDIQVGADSSQIFGVNSGKGVFVYYHPDSLWRRVSRGLKSSLSEAGRNGNEFEEVVYNASSILPMANQQLLTISGGTLFYRSIADCFVPIEAPVFTGSYTEAGVQFNLNWQQSNTPGVTHYDIHDSEIVDHSVASSASSYSFIDYYTNESRKIRILASVDGDQSTFDQIILLSSETSSTRFEAIEFAKEKAVINSTVDFEQIEVDLDTIYSYELGTDYYDVLLLDSAGLDVWLSNKLLVISNNSVGVGSYEIVVQATNHTDLTTTDTLFFNVQKPLSTEQGLEIFSIYPNPAVNGKVNVQSTEGIQSILITSITGQVLKSEEFSDGSKTVEINLSQFISGLYFIELQTQSNKIVRKKLKID